MSEMSCFLTVALKRATRMWGGQEFAAGNGRELFRRRLDAFVSFEHIFNIPFQNKQIRRRLAVDL